MRHTRLTVWIVLVTVATVVLGVVTWPRDDARALRAYREATLIANEGLGDLRLGTSTLAAVLEHLGAGTAAALYGDTTGLEFGYGAGGLTLRFWLGDDCARTVQAMHGSGLRALRDPRGFTRAHPECADERLDAIELAAGAGERTTFWRGQATAGVRLRMPREDALERLATVPAAYAGPFGLPADPEVAMALRVVEVGGLRVHFAPDRSAALGDWIVSRLVVVAPAVPDDARSRHPAAEHAADVGSRARQAD